jgi:hypothetical protein
MWFFRSFPRDHYEIVDAMSDKANPSHFQRYDFTISMSYGQCPQWVEPSRGT